MNLRNVNEEKFRDYMFISISVLGALWILFILLLGIQLGSEQDLRPFFSFIWTEDQLANFLPPLEISYGGIVVSTDKPYDFIQFLVRKGAHFIVYGILSLIVSIQQLIFRRDPKRAYILGLFFAGFVGSIDEFIQFFHPDRGGMVLDVILNMSGSSIALIWLVIVFKRVPDLTEKV